MLIKFLINTLLIALLSFIGGLFFPYWVIAPIAFVVSLLIPLRPPLAFLSGFLALFLLWGGLALAANLANGGILATKIAWLLPLGGSPYALILVTALVGALVGGGGALTASFVKNTR
jgi:hypothetical protein